MNRQTALITIALVMLAIFTTAFALINYGSPVKVWPLQNVHPLTLVIGASFVLGAGVSGLASSLLSHRRTLLAGADPQKQSVLRNTKDQPTSVGH